MRCPLSVLATMMCVLSSCGDDCDSAPAGQFVTHQRIVYSDGLHNENTEMIRLGDRILLIFRGGEEGQVGSARARIKIFESTDDGKTFHLLSEVNANNLDPK